LVGTILLAVALGSVHATPFDGVLVIAQAPQADQEKAKRKRKSRRSSRARHRHNSVKCNRRRHSDRFSHHHRRRDSSDVKSVRYSRPHHRRCSVRFSPHRHRWNRSDDKSDRCSRPRRSSVKCSHHLHRRSSVRFSRRRQHNHSSNRCSRPHRVRSLRRFRSSNKVNAVPGAWRSNRRVRLHRSSRSDSPPWHRPRFNRRLRRPDLKRRNSNAPSCHRRLRIMRPVLKMSAGLAARCVRAIVS